MADVQRAPQQSKQPSRKGKKAWRKNVDISQVQSGLEDARDEILQGGIVAEKSADQLFTLDTTGNENIKREYTKQHKPLKADEIIAARSVIPAVDSRKRKTADGVAEPSSKRSKNGTYVSHKDLQRLKSVANSAAAGLNTTVDVRQVDHDPWSVEPVPQQDPRFSFLDPKKPIVEPVTRRLAPISLSATGKPFAAVRKPNAGKSYNPDFQDWESLVQREGKKEVEAETKRLRDAQAEAERMEKALAEAARPEPVSDEEYESAWESEFDGFQSGAEDAAALTKKRPERKTQPERNKIKRRKEAERKAKWDAQMKKRDEQHTRIKEIATEIQRKERDLRLQLAAAANASSDESGDEEVLRRRKLGRIPVPEAPLEVVLADELQDSLRALRPEGNLLKDRFRNLLVNGKIESRRPITQPKKPKRTATEKWTYKDWKLR